MNNYFRITGYFPAKDVCFIADSNGLYNEIWEFSAALIGKGVKVLEVGDDKKFKYGNIEAAEPDRENIYSSCLRQRATYLYERHGQYKRQNLHTQIINIFRS